MQSCTVHRIVAAVPGASSHAASPRAKRLAACTDVRARRVCIAMDTHQMSEQDKVIPITRGRRSRVRLIVSPGTTSLGVRLQPIREPTAPTPQITGQLVEFRPRSEKGDQNVNIYRIDDHNRVHVLPDGGVRDGATFSRVEDLEQLVAAWPMRRLVEIWNELPDVRAVARFENRKVAVQRIWQALQAQTDRPQQPRRKRERPVRESKLQMILRMLRAPEGTTLDALMKATRWQAHSVRGFLSRKVSKQLALPVESFRRDGQRVYRLPAAQ